MGKAKYITNLWNSITVGEIRSPNATLLTKVFTDRCDLRSFLELGELLLLRIAEGLCLFPRTSWLRWIESILDAFKVERGSFWWLGG